MVQGGSGAVPARGFRPARAVQQLLAPESRRRARRRRCRIGRGVGQAQALDPDLADVGVRDFDLDRVGMNAGGVDLYADGAGQPARALPRRVFEDAGQPLGRRISESKTR